MKCTRKCSTVHTCCTGVSLTQRNTVSKCNMPYIASIYTIQSGTIIHAMYSSECPKMHWCDRFWGILSDICISPQWRNVSTGYKLAQYFFVSIGTILRHVRCVEHARHTSKHVATCVGAQMAEMTFYPPAGKAVSGLLL